MADEIDTGDTVFHRPSGETWTVAYVFGNKYLAWCGWPPGEARLEDCELREKAAPEYRDKLLRQLAEMSVGPGEYDRRKSYAQQRLAENKELQR